MKKSFLLVLLLTSIISCAKKNDSNDEVTLDGLYQIGNCENIINSEGAPADYLSYRRLIRISGTKASIAEQRFNQTDCSGTSSLWWNCPAVPGKGAFCEYDDLQDYSTVQFSEFADIPENFYLGIQEVKDRPATGFPYFILYRSPSTGDLRAQAGYQLEQAVTSFAELSEKFPCSVPGFSTLGTSQIICVDDFVANPDLGNTYYTKIDDITDVPAPVPTTVDK